MNHGLTLEEIAAKDVPAGKPFKIVDVADLPSDYTFFNAWEGDFSNPDGHGIGLAGQQRWAHLLRDFTAHSEGMAEQQRFGCDGLQLARDLDQPHLVAHQLALLAIIAAGIATMVGDSVPLRNGDVIAIAQFDVTFDRVETIDEPLVETAARTPDGTGSGWASKSFNELRQVEPTKIATAAIDKALSLNTNISFLREIAIGLIIIAFLMFEPDGLAHRWRQIKTYWKLYPFSH